MPMRAGNTKAVAMRALTIGAFAALVLQPAGGQTDGSRIMASAKPAAAAAAGHPVGSKPSDVAKTLKDAAETLGLARWSAVGGQRLPEVDVINTMEMWASGTTYNQSGTAIKTDYHASLGYNPPAMRVEMALSVGLQRGKSAAQFSGSCPFWIRLNSAASRGKSFS